MFTMSRPHWTWTGVAIAGVMAGSSGAQSVCMDTWEPLGAGLSDAGAVLAVHDDGAGPALYVAGTFLTAGGTISPRIARWDGSRWSGVDRGINGPVWSLQSVQSGRRSTLYAGGQFTLPIGGPPTSRIAGWDGTQWSPPGTGLSGCAYPLVSWGACFVPTSVNAMASLDADGAGPNPPALYAGGNFLVAGISQADYIASWNGAAWSPVGGGIDYVVDSLAVFDDGAGNGPALIAGGDFSHAGGVAAARIAKWNGTSWAPLGSGLNGVPLAMAVFDDGSGSALYVGGRFSIAGGVQAFNVARWNGSSWSAVGTGVSRQVNAMTVFDDGTGSALYAAGNLAGENIARWDGASWSALPGTNGTINALAVFDDGNGPALYATGEFRSAGGQPASRIARLTCRVRGDIDGDRRVDIGDLRLLFSNWSIPPTAQGCAGARPCPADLNGDGFVGAADLQVLLSNWTP